MPNDCAIAGWMANTAAPAMMMPARAATSSFSWFLVISIPEGVEFVVCGV